jgi:hypothetical protein
VSEPYPRIRVRDSDGTLRIRDSLSFTFYMRQPHAQVAQKVLRTLESYQAAVGAKTLSLYTDQEGFWWPLNAAGWELTRQQFQGPDRAWVHLSSGLEQGYHFDYIGKDIGHPHFARHPGVVSTVSFWLPTEYLEEHGPARVRELAMELAAPLPFCSGHAGLTFKTGLSLVGMMRESRELCFRYPGLDVPDLDHHSLNIGTRIGAVSWLTFLGQPVLGELGGVAGLRSRLLSPGTTVQEMEAERALITLGPRPEAGDTEEGRALLAYRELAGVLAPWLYFKAPPGNISFSELAARDHEALIRWQRRFLD